MRPERVVIAVPYLLLAASCTTLETSEPSNSGDAGDGDGGLLAAPPVHFCDGRAGLQLGMLILPDPALVPYGSQVMSDNGSVFLLVDGSCRFWVQQNAASWAPTRTGVLSPDEEARLTSLVRYAEWRDWSGQWTPHDSVFDAPARLLWPGTVLHDQVACLKGCTGEGLPAGLVSATQATAAAAVSLADAGTPLDGGMRYQVVAIAPESVVPVPYFDWQVPGVTLAEVALGPGEAARLPYGAGRLAEGESAAALRDLRARHASSDAAKNHLVPYIPVKDADGGRYELYVRDALPFEDDAGLVRPL